MRSVQSWVGIACILALPLNAQRPSPELARQALAISEERDRLDQTVWQQEIEAQKYGDVIVAFWDGLRASTNKFQTLASIPFQQIKIPTFGPYEMITPDIQKMVKDQSPITYSNAEWNKMIRDLGEEGYVLESTEWHHSHFSIHPTSPPLSNVDFKLFFTHPIRQERVKNFGQLLIEWNTGNPPEIRSIIVKSLSGLVRTGPPQFSHWTSFKQAVPSENAQSNINLYDLNHDGFTDIILGHQNRVLINQGGAEFRSQPLSGLRNDQAVSAGIVADFTGDGIVDYVCGILHDDAYLFEGSADGSFSDQGLPIGVSKPLQFPSVLSAGDIDQDGDLDLWIGQYKAPYQGGQMPTPYYDANDGYPFYLMRNEGDGSWTDITEESGLATHRFRRVYSGSLTDLNEDGRTDLLVVSDFAGADLYLQQEDGSFADKTKEWNVAERSFGMSHSFGDFNRDGFRDLLVIGMHSTTARRLTGLNAGRSDFSSHQDMRPVMGFGNRLYLGLPSGGFQLSPATPLLAKSGWSWGNQSFDVDNDGDEDIYIANGHVSGQSAQDYCSTFWRHDIYQTHSTESPALDLYFDVTVNKELHSVYSWNGFEHNTLFLNLDEHQWEDVAFLYGIDFVYDSRTVLTEDFDNDGRLDLLVSEKHYGRGETLHLYRNQIHPSGNWIAFRLSTSTNSPVDAKLTVHTDEGVFTRHYVTGDSFAAQQSPTLHIGLGEIDTVLHAEIRWMNGAGMTIENPSINQYHDLP